MSEDNEPITVVVDTTELDKKVAGLQDQVKALREDVVQKEVTDAKPEPMEEEDFDYKAPLVEMLKTKKSFTTDIKVKKKLEEAIGAVSAANAIPEIWAADVERCCPFPASAFWGAPFMKWHDDVKGAPGDTVNVVTVGKADCITPYCEEGTTTAASVGKEAITLTEYKCAHYICKTDLEDMVPDTVTELNNTLRFGGHLEET